MSYFSKFPKTTYTFFENQKPQEFVDLFRQVKIIERRLDPVSIYQKYFIRNSRPDQVSHELYKSDDYYWTFFLINDNLRSGMNKWPLNDFVINDFINEKYVGYTLTPYRELSDDADFNSIGGQFPVGTVITGSVSGATATVTERKPILNQLVFTYDSAATFNEGTDTFTGVDSDGVTYQILNTQYDIRTHPNSPHHYEDTNGNTIINQTNLQLTAGIITNTDYETEVNEEYKEIRVVKPRYIQSFSNEVLKLLNE